MKKHPYLCNIILLSDVNDAENLQIESEQDSKRQIITFVKEKNQYKMIQRLSNPQAVLGWWLAIGLLMGLSFGLLINSMTVGIPMGLAASVWAGHVVGRMCKTLL